jgi:hypothetical protein
MRNRTRPWVCLASAGIIGSLACNRPAPAPAPTPDADAEAERANPAQPVEGSTAAEPSEPVAEPPAEPPPSFAGIDLTRAPELVGADLAAHWCERGGASFRPPAKSDAEKDDEYPWRLEDCAEIEVELREAKQAEGVRATILSIDAGGLELRELLLLQTKDHSAWVSLRHVLHDESGEGGTHVTTYADVELRDVTGTPTPEWIGAIQSQGGDSFEADRCYSHDDDTRDLIICSERTEGFACASVRVRALSVIAPRSKDMLDDCDTPGSELDPAQTEGYALEATLRRDELVLTPSKQKIHEPSEPPYAGKVPLATLFDEDPLAVGVFEDP